MKQLGPGESIATLATTAKRKGQLMTGIFVSLDGVDGAGKSTQIKLLVDRYEQRGRKVISLRDPGGTKLGETLREILLHRQEIPLAMKSEMLLYMASRAQLVAEVIRPALADGQVVISDRYLLANVVYQGCGGGEDPDQIWQVGMIATGGLLPHLTCILDLPVEISMARLTRELDRLESRGLDFMNNVRQGFLKQASRLGNAVEIIDALLDPQQIHARIVEALLARGLE